MDPFGRHRYPLTELPGYSVPSPMYSPETSLHDLPEEHPDPAQHLEELRNVLRDSTDHPVPGPPQAISGRERSVIIALVITAELYLRLIICDPLCRFV